MGGREVEEEGRQCHGKDSVRADVSARANEVYVRLGSRGWNIDPTGRAVQNTPEKD